MGFALLLAFLAALMARPLLAMPIDPGDPGHGSGPAPTATTAPAPTQAASAPVGQSDSSSCTIAAYASSDFSTFYVVCQPALQYYGPGGNLTGGALPVGTYTIENDRRCFAGSAEFDCYLDGGYTPNWFKVAGTWVTNGIQYTLPASATGTQPTPGAETSSSTTVTYKTTITVEGGPTRGVCSRDSSPVNINGTINTDYPGTIQYHWSSPLGEGLWAADSDHTFSFDVTWPGVTETDSYVVNISVTGGLSEQVALASTTVTVGEGPDCNYDAGPDTLPSNHSDPRD